MLSIILVEISLHVIIENRSSKGDLCRSKFKKMNYWREVVELAHFDIVYVTVAQFVMKPFKMQVI